MNYEKTLWVDNVTPYSAQNMNKIEAGIYNALREAGAMTAFNIFITNANTNSLDAAFGKNRRSGEMHGLGLALAWVAWYYGVSEVSYPFTNLITKDTLQEILADINSSEEALSDPNIANLIKSAPYALTQLNSTWGSSTGAKDMLCHITGLTGSSYADVTALLTNSTARTTITQSLAAMRFLANSSVSMTVCYNNAATFETAFQASAVALQALSEASKEYTASAAANSGSVLINKQMFIVEFKWETSLGGTTTLKTFVNGTTVTKPTSATYAAVNKFASDFIAYNSTGTAAIARFIKAIYI